jgi:hypothetical protein
MSGCYSAVAVAAVAVAEGSGRWEAATGGGRGGVVTGDAGEAECGRRTGQRWHS